MPLVLNSSAGVVWIISVLKMCSTQQHLGGVVIGLALQFGDFLGHKNWFRRAKVLNMYVIVLCTYLGTSRYDI